MSDQTSLSVDAETLAFLRCPLTHSRLRLEGHYLVGEVGGLRYPIREGFPCLLVEEAQLPEGVASLDEFKRRYAEHVV